MANNIHYKKEWMYVSIGSMAILAIVFVLAAGNTQQSYAPPVPSCPNCATQINGSGFGTITIPENPEIAPAPCINCFATISFEAITDAKEKVQNGTITIEYVDSEDVTQTKSGEFFDGTVTVGKNSFKLLGTIIQGPASCPACTDVDFTLKGAIQKDADTADLTLKAADGTAATFDNVEVTITSIPTET